MCERGNGWCVRSGVVTWLFVKGWFLGQCWYQDISVCGGDRDAGCRSVTESVVLDCVDVGRSGVYRSV